MKRNILAAVVTLLPLVGSLPAQAQGRIRLYNYNFNGVTNPITWGITGEPITGASGFTMGMYYALGDVVGAANTGMAGYSWTLPPPYLTVAMGPGATTPLGDFQPGQYSATADWIVPGSGSTAQPVTIVVVTHNGADYASSTLRAHSQAFLMTTAVGVDFAPVTGDYMNGFAIMPIPEPPTLTLAAGSVAALLIKRRRKAIIKWPGELEP